jgi:predicted ATPase/class 3 adenylate cyclase/Tfp pilus assembly protein PilF
MNEDLHDNVVAEGIVDTPGTSGTITFLFTDIEAGTQAWERDSAAMRAAHARYQTILREAIEANGGDAYKTMGDALHSAFSTPSQALQAAIDAQMLLFAEEWPPSIGELKVRMALHTGVTGGTSGTSWVVEEGSGHYFGPVLNRAAGILSAAHGGQILLSAATQELARDLLPGLQPSAPPGVTLEDLGEHNLKDLTRPEHLYQLVVPGLPAYFPAVRTLASMPNNLPRQSTPFIGREKETDAVIALLRRGDTNVVTLTGTGGTGKTRLSMQVGAEMLEEYEDGVWFVELATLPPSEHWLVPNAIAEALRVKESPGRPLIETLKGYLKDKKTLLVLDNFEQVMPAAPQVSGLLKAAPGVKALVTSRITLQVYGEREYQVPLLSMPDPRRFRQHKQTGPLTGTPGTTGPLYAARTPDEEMAEYTQYEAVRLFVDRAQAVKADFEITAENAATIGEICVRLDGLPLAIELAAARIRMLPPQALLTRLSSRLKMLTGGATDLPARQQTLRNAIEWSYDLLTEPDKQLFRRMSVFSGGRTFEGLEAICNYDGRLEVDVLDGVESLGSKSLLQRREGSDGELRFWMLETIQEYAFEKLKEEGEAEELGKEHALYYMRLAEEAEQELTGKQQGKWLNRLEDEHDNLRAALRWAREASSGQGPGAGRIESPAEIALRIAGALWRFWLVRGYFSEGREELEEALSASAPAYSGDVAEAAGNPLAVPRAKALNGVGRLADREGDHPAARAYYDESLALRRELGDKKGIAETLRNIGILASNEGDYPTAHLMYEQSLQLMRELGDKSGVAETLNSLGGVALREGNYSLAHSMYEQCLALMRELGDKRSIARMLNNLAIVMADKEGSFTQARSLFEQSLVLMRELGDKSGIAMLLNNLGGLSDRQKDYPKARSQFEQSLVLMRELGDKSGSAEILDNLGDVASNEGEYRTAHSYYEQSLTLMKELGDKKGVATALASLGRLAGEAKPGDAERGGKLLGAAEGILEAIGGVLDPGEQQRHEQGTEAIRSQLGDEAFKAAYAEGQAMSLEAAIEYALVPWAGALVDTIPQMGVGERAQPQPQEDELHMVINQAKKAQQVEAITGTDYFRELQAKVTSLRSRTAG